LFISFVSLVFVDCVHKSNLSHSYHLSQCHPSTSRTKDSVRIEKTNPDDEDQKFERTTSASHHASHIQFFPYVKGIVACINCVPTTHRKGTNITASQQPEGTRRLGPIMLDLRQVDLVATDDSFTSDSFFSTSTIGVSRGNPSLGISVASTCLDLPPVKSFTSKSRFVAATGSTTGMLCIHTFGEPDNGGLLSSNIEYFHTSRRQATATSVAWRPVQLNHVAVGLLGSSASAQPQAPPRRGGGSIRAAGGDFCCLIWDVEKQSTVKQRSSSPLFKLSHNSPVASLAWMMDGSTLAVGSQNRILGIYDMRISGTNVPPITVHAHGAGIHGIEVDPFRPNIIATFSRSAGEPVKMWDIRRMDSVLGEIKVGSGPSKTVQSTASSQVLNQGIVEAIKWTTLEPGTLSVAIDGTIHDYDTKSGSRPVLVGVNHVNEGSRIRDFALYPTEDKKRSEEGNESQPDKILKQLRSRRILAVLDDRNVYDLAKHTYAPVAISYRDGRLAHSLGTSLFVGSTTMGKS
jgi:WD40 repeat protein